MFILLLNGLHSSSWSIHKIQAEPGWNIVGSVYFRKWFLSVGAQGAWRSLNTPRGFSISHSCWIVLLCKCCVRQLTRVAPWTSTAVGIQTRTGRGWVGRVGEWIQSKHTWNSKLLLLKNIKVYIYFAPNLFFDKPYLILLLWRETMTKATYKRKRLTGGLPTVSEG